MLKIYDRSGFPNPARIRIVLAEKGLDSSVEFVPVDLIGAEHKGAAYLAKNPSGVIPALELDDGTIISEATAITEYLDNLDGNPTLTGKTPKEKALVHMMQRRAESYVLDPVGIYFHFGTPGLDQLSRSIKALSGPVALNGLAATRLLCRTVFATSTKCSASRRLSRVTSFRWPTFRFTRAWRLVMRQA